MAKTSKTSGSGVVEAAQHPRYGPTMPLNERNSQFDLWTKVVLLSAAPTLNQHTFDVQRPFDVPRSAEHPQHVLKYRPQSRYWQPDSSGEVMVDGLKSPSRCRAEVTPAYPVAPNGQRALPLVVGGFAPLERTPIYTIKQA